MRILWCILNKGQWRFEAAALNVSPWEDFTVQINVVLVSNEQLSVCSLPPIYGVIVNVFTAELFCSSD